MGLVLGAIAANKAAKAERAALERQAEIDKKNQEIADRKAGEIIEAGAEAANDYREKTRQTVGSQRAILGASGVDVDSRSVLNAQLEALAFGEQDALTIVENAEKQARDMREQGAQFGAQADLALAARPSVGLATLAGGVSQLASFGAGVAMSYKPYKLYNT